MNRGYAKRAGTRVPVTLFPAGSKYPRVFMSDPIPVDRVGSDRVDPRGSWVIDERANL